MIPKKIHLAWINKNLLDSDSPLIIHGVKKLIELNPEWEVTFYDDEEIDAYLKEKLDAPLYDLIAHKHPVQKTDIWRLIKIYTEGGLYLDIDRFCDTTLENLLEENTKWVLPICRDYDFSHDFMMSAPENPVYKVAIDMYLHRLQDGHTNIYFLGAQTYMHAITFSLLGEIVNTDPGKEVFKSIKDKLNAIDFIKVYEEDPPYHTVIYREGQLNIDWEKEKRKFYKESGIKHWSGEW